LLLIAMAVSARIAEAGDAPYFALPMELESDFGASNGNATLLRFMPLYAYPRKTDWRLIHLSLITLADAPGGTPGRPSNPEPDPDASARASGLTDFIHASFYTPARKGNFIWGAGAMMSIPTATDSALGSSKWAAGPALRFTYRKGAWNVGAFGGHRWSFAGDSGRADVNQTLIRWTIRRRLGNKWFLVSAPLWTGNFNSPSSERWLLPMGGGIGRGFTFADNPWAVSFQVYGNVVKPEGAPDWIARLALIAAIPMPADA